LAEHPSNTGALSIKAIWNDTVVAESDDTVLVEGNHYFPAAALNQNFVSNSNHKTVCGWKGQASYYSLLVNGELNSDAVWYYADPKPEADNIRGRVAFWKGVKVVA
jgi:uncharacterized protein (DUF427 family)